MPRLIDRLFHRFRKPPKAYRRPNQAYHTPVIPVSESTNQSSITKGQLEDHPLQQDLWQCAYDQLDQKAQDILSRIEIPAQLGNDKNNPRTEGIIDKVIQITGEQYEEYQQGGIKIQRPTGEDIDLRKFSQKTIDAALSFKAIIDAVVKFDPTQHAASVWAVVSLGLTMTKNRSDLRDVLFNSSEYLADVLARCAFIEDNFYRINPGKSAEIGHVIVRVYKAILQYTAEILSAQNPSMGRWILDSVAAITNERLMELQSSIKEEEKYLCQWVEFDQHLQHQKKAKSILAGIDKMSESIQDLIQKFNILNLHMAEGALYDSYIDEHEDMCLPDTRVELRHQITEWAELSDKCIFWLNGMAGTGKSTIARTVAQSFKERGQLGASFFFKRGEADRDTAKRLISTIMRQLVTANRRLLPGISKALQNDPIISAKSLSEQFNKLLFEPLQILEPSQTTAMVIVIDALDECEKEHDIEVLLKLLPQLQKCRSIRLQIFLTSRPELPIRLGFEKSNDHQDLVLHELPRPVIEHDIRIFLKDRFPVIKEKRKISGDWPGDDTIEDLVTMAVPLFIFAATICRFVGEGRHPEKCLQNLLNFQEVTSASQMDKIYLPILGQVLTGSNEDELNELIREFQDIVGVIILLAAPLPVNFLARLLRVHKKDISDLLDPLHSVLSVPDDINAPVRILHLSFRDYLLNTKSAFHVDEKKTHQRIASCCLHILNTSLTQNICGLSSYGTQRMDIHNQVINQHMSADLQYSCRYWVYHLEQSRAHISEEEIFPFLEKYFLHWLEAMSLMGAISETLAIINTLQSSIGSKVQSEFSQFLYDSKRFILQNIQMADTAPLQLYRSGLAFSPLGSKIRKMFGKDLCKWLHTMPQVKDSWSAELQTLEGHSDWVWSVAFSPDGKMVASGSGDHTIKIWQADTGTELQTLQGHSGWVQSVAFSPDGKTVASGSDDCTVKIWQADTGTELQTLQGHSDSVRSVAFSPDGKTVASGSDDCTVKIWQADTGTELQTPQGRSTTDQPSAQVSIKDCWVAFRGEKILWLPSEYRAFSCSATKDGALALGYDNGRVLIMSFCMPVM